MTDIVERRFGGLTVQIDRTLCVGFGDCIDVAPDLFEYDDDGVVSFKPNAPEAGRDLLIEACEACPVDALTLLDEDGRQVVP